MLNNAFFKTTDPTLHSLDGFVLPVGWWSRPYEYAWAISHAGAGMVVADMGCGYTYRPFKGGLSNICHHVYAVDGDTRLLNQECKPNMTFVIGDLTRPIPELPVGKLDRVFCISVLEDVGAWTGRALYQFAQLIKDDGAVVVTMDSLFDNSRPQGDSRYPGVNIDVFMRDVELAGLVFDGPIDLDKTGAIYNESLNLCVFHAVLRKE